MGKINLVPYLVPHLDKNLPVFRGSIFLALLKEAVAFSNVTHESITKQDRNIINDPQKAPPWNGQ